MKRTAHNPFSSLGLSAADAARGIARLRCLGWHTQPFFRVEARTGGAFAITYYDPDRDHEIKEWFVAKGYPPKTVNGVGWYVDCDGDLALQAKLTFGGAA